MEKITKEVRLYQREVKQFADSLVYKESLLGYGVSEQKREKINNIFEETDATYTDFLFWLLQNIPSSNLAYLELGVSLGKNLYPLLASVKGDFYALDVEKLNPKLYTEGKLSVPQLHETWSISLPEDLSLFSENDRKTIELFGKHCPNAHHYLVNHPNGNLLNYYQANILDEVVWGKLPSQKFNVIFSDAWHKAASVRFEIAKIIENNLLADTFFILLDDMEFGLEDTVLDCFKSYPLLNAGDLVFMKMKGWNVGDEPHKMALITNNISIIKNSIWQQFLM